MADRIARPVPFKDLEQQFKSRGPLRDASIALERRFHVAADREPQVRTRLERVAGGKQDITANCLVLGGTAVSNTVMQLNL